MKKFPLGINFLCIAVGWGKKMYKPTFPIFSYFYPPSPPPPPEFWNFLGFCSVNWLVSADCFFFGLVLWYLLSFLLITFPFSIYGSKTGGWVISHSLSLSPVFFGSCNFIASQVFCYLISLKEGSRGKHMHSFPVCAYTGTLG